MVLFDFLGFGLSDKPDLRYGIRLHADLAQQLVRSLGFDEIALLTHDMGDSVGGELLARSLEGTLGFGIERRVITNGSIYLTMAQLTAGQNGLLSLPDERLPGGPADEWRSGFTAGLAGTFAPARQPSADELDVAVAAHGDRRGSPVAAAAHPVHRGSSRRRDALHRSDREATRRRSASSGASSTPSRCTRWRSGSGSRGPTRP